MSANFLTGVEYRWSSIVSASWGRGAVASAPSWAEGNQRRRGVMEKMRGKEGKTIKEDRAGWLASKSDLIPGFFPGIPKVQK